MLWIQFSCRIVVEYNARMKWKITKGKSEILNIIPLIFLLFLTNRTHFDFLLKLTNNFPTKFHCHSESRQIYVKIFPRECRKVSWSIIIYKMCNKFMVEHFLFWLRNEIILEMKENKQVWCFLWKLFKRTFVPWLDNSFPSITI
jgi:hypothetical protein